MSQEGEKSRAVGAEVDQLAAGWAAWRQGDHHVLAGEAHAARVNAFEAASILCLATVRSTL